MVVIQPCVGHLTAMKTRTRTARPAAIAEDVGADEAGLELARPRPPQLAHAGRRARVIEPPMTGPSTSAYSTRASQTAGQ